MRSHRRSALLTSLLFALAAGVFHAQTPGQAAAPAIPKGTVEQVKVHGKSLEGNLEMDSPDRDVFIYLPPSYSSNTALRYPVVYMLHGYGLTAARWMPFTKMADAADKDIAAGTMREMILVNPDAYTKYNGSMYSASQTTGDWEAFIADDLVAYVDSHYRTIANRASRGLGGHSMGGYGTIRIGMKRPDVFSTLYIMSACCLLNNPQLPRAAAADAPAAPAPSGQGAAGAGGRGNAFANAPFAQAAAWAANPANPPSFYDEPVKDGKLQPLIVGKYLANSPLVMIDQYATNLRKYNAIAGDVGLQDNLLASNQQLEQTLTSLGIRHTFETYEGNHTDHVPQRIEEKVLPFFSKTLAFR